MTNLLLTPGDVELFHWLWMLRIATIDHCRRLRYFQPETGRLSSPDNVRKRLARLAGAGYLERGDLLDEENLRPIRVYFLGERALEPLRSRYGLDQRRLYRFKETSLRYAHHALWVSEFGVRLIESTRGSLVTLPDLAPMNAPLLTTHLVEHPGKRRHVKRFATQEDIVVPGIPEVFRVRPDLVFGLKIGNAARLYFLEADRGTEGLKQIEEKLTAYAHYAKTDRWQRYLVAPEFRVLVVTTTEQRVASLLELLVHHPAASRVAFTTMTAVTEQAVLRAPVWKTGAGDCASLLQAAQKDG